MMGDDLETQNKDPDGLGGKQPFIIATLVLLTIVVLWLTMRFNLQIDSANADRKALFEHVAVVRRCVESYATDAAGIYPIGLDQKLKELLSDAEKNWPPAHPQLQLIIGHHKTFDEVYEGTQDHIGRNVVEYTPFGICNYGAVGYAIRAGDPKTGLPIQSGGEMLVLTGGVDK